jgi:hypothetical protein
MLVVGGKYTRFERAAWQLTQALESGRASEELKSVDPAFAFSKARKPDGSDRNN